MVCSGKESAERIRESPCQTQRGLVVQLLHHGASDLRKHVVGVAANQSDRANHDHQDYREHHRVFGDVLTVLFSPKLTDCLDHCLPPIDDTPELYLSLGTGVRRRVIIKIS